MGLSYVYEQIKQSIKKNCNIFNNVESEFLLISNRFEEYYVYSLFFFK